MANAVATFDFTYFCDNLDEYFPIVRDWCKDVSKKWCFQYEEGSETNRKHFQGRLSLKVKKREIEFIKSIPQNLKGMHISITSKENVKNNFYVLKEDTRVSGPWSSEDKEVYIPRDVRKIKDFYSWQNTVLDLCKKEEDRIVNIIYDPHGNNGKSTLIRYCMVHQIGRKLPLCNDYKDLMRMVMDMPDSNNYFIDMPRAIGKERLYQFYGAIEEIKSGYAFDDRYSFKEKIFDPPNVFIFTNQLPDQGLLSKDRWVIWTIVDNELKKYHSSPEELLGASL